MLKPASLKATDILALLDADEKDAILTSPGLEVSATADAILSPLDEFSISSLLQAVVRLRMPFIRMMNDIADLLETVEAYVRGNIRFIVLPDSQAELRLDFGPQLRAAVARGLDPKLLQSHEEEVQVRLAELDRHLYLLCDRLKPMPVKRYDAHGQLLKNLSHQVPPADRFRNEWLAENVFKRHVREYNPMDKEGIRKIGDRLARLRQLLHRLSQEQSSPNPLWQKLISSVSRLSGQVQAKQASGPVSVEYPPPRRSVQDEEFQATTRKIDRLEEAVLAASKFEEAHSDLFDFLSLELWKQRWRIYELWILARMVRTLRDWGAMVTDTSRIVDGRWLLKFTKDSRPILKLELQGQVVELLYQFYQGRGETGDMPDVALRLGDQRYLAVIDPKHGESYSRKNLNEVCLRYADAFEPYLSCVVNYFPARPSELLADIPRSLVLYALAPGTEADQELQKELEDSMGKAWSDRQLRIIRPISLVVVFDGSPSSESCRGMLLAALDRRWSTLMASPRLESLALIFGSSILREGKISDLVDGKLLRDLPFTGTNVNLALQEGSRRLSDLPQPRELWLLTDRQGSLDIDRLESELIHNGSTLVAFEWQPAGASPLEQLVRRLQGEYVAL